MGSSIMRSPVSKKLGGLFFICLWTGASFGVLCVTCFLAKTLVPDKPCISGDDRSNSLDQSNASVLASDEPSLEHQSMIRWNHESSSDAGDGTNNSFMLEVQKWLVGIMVGEDGVWNKILEQGSEMINITIPIGSISLKRILQENRWAEFNKIFDSASLHFPGTRIDTSLVFALDLLIIDPYCKDIAIEDLVLTITQVNAQQLKVNVDLLGLDILCYSDYSYAYGGRFIGKTRGEGTVVMKTSDNYAKAEITFTTSAPSFDVAPPDNVVAQVLDVKFHIYGLDFHGNWIAGFLDTFNKLFREYVEDQLQKAAESELGSLGTKFLADVVSGTHDMIRDYLMPIPSSLSDPLQIEIDFVDSGIALDGFIKFKDLSNNSIASLVSDLLGKADQMFGRYVPDPSMATGQDLGVNKFLRENLLDPNTRSLTISTADLPFEIDTVLFDSHDAVSKSQIVLDGITIIGLDTFKAFDPLVDIGNFTMQNSFHLETLQILLNLVIEIRPSDLPDAMLRNANANVVVREEISVSFGVDNLQIMLSVFLLLKEAALLSLQLGSILKKENIVACVGSIIHSLRIAGFSTSITNIHQPVLQGFISPGIDHLITTSVDAVFRMYEATFLKASPHIFQTTVRDILEKEVNAAIADFLSTTACDWDLPEEAAGAAIDFRELFLRPEDSRLYGGLGDEPFGSLAAIGYSILQDTMQDTDNSGSLGINEIVETLTKAQSGYPGFVKLPDFSSFSFEDGADSLQKDIRNRVLRGLIAKVDFSVTNLFVQNLNTVRLPLEFLKATTHPITLKNEVNLGLNGAFNPSVSSRMSLMVESDLPSPLAFADEINLTISMGSLHILADAMVNLTTSSFMSFPLGSIFDLNCWLALVPEVEEGKVPPLSLESFALNFTDMTVESDILSSSSPGILIVPEVVEILRNSGFTTLLAFRLQTLVGDLFGSEMISDMLKNKVASAKKKCQSNPLFDGTFEGESSEEVTGFSLSPTGIDTVFHASIVLVQVGIIVLLENHLHFKGQMPALGHLPPESFDVLDWTNIGDSLGLGRSVDEAFRMGRNYLQGVNSEGELNINSLLESLAPEGVVTVELDDLSFKVGGLTLNATSVSLGGLNTFRSVFVLNPLSPQKLSNSFSMGKLFVEIELSISSVDGDIVHSQNVRLSSLIKDINASFELFAAFNVTKLLDLRLGSFLWTENVLPCLLSSAISAGLENLNVTVGEFEVPKVIGLMPESGNSLNRTIFDLYDRFMGDVKSSIPIFFNTTVKTLLNNVLGDFVKNKICEKPTVAEKDFFEISELFQGNGSLGDSLNLLWNLAETIFLGAEDKSGLSSLNTFVDVITKAQSGEGGQFYFSQLLASFATGRFHRIGIQMTEFEIGNLTVNNVDTIQAPVMVLQPDEANASLLKNHIRLGTKPYPLRVMLNSMLNTSGDPLLSSQNELDVGVEFVMLDIFAVISARVRATELLNFPLWKLTNYNCWLALFGAPLLDKRGVKLPGEVAGLSIQNLALDLESMYIRASCHTVGACTTSGMAYLSSILTKHENTEVAVLVKESFLKLVDELLAGSFFQTFLDRMLADAASLCLGSTSESNGGEQFATPQFPPISPIMLDSMVFLAVYFFEILFVVVLKSHESYVSAYVNPLLAQAQLEEFPIDKELIDFTNLSASIGNWTGTVVERLRSFAEEAVNIDGEEDVGLNSILRATLLDETGLMVFDLSKHSRIDPVFSIMLGDLVFQGMDSVVSASLLQPIGPQTLKTEIMLDHVTARLYITVKTEETEMKGFVEVEVDKVRVDAVIFVAIEKAILGNLQLGQILDSDRIFKCLLSSASTGVSFPVLDVSVRDIMSFRIEGFDDSSVAANVEKIIAINLNEYKEIILGNMGYFFNYSIKAVLNNWIRYMFTKDSTTFCPKEEQRVLRKAGVSAVDFRDLLLPPDESMELGGTGQEQYGNIIRMLMTMLKDKVLKVDQETGMSSINSFLISEMTKSQSNVSGRVNFFGDLLTFGKRIQIGGLDLQITFRAYDGYIENLDTIGEPFSLLDPVLDKGSNLNNSAAIGLGLPLRFGTHLFLSIVGSGQEIVNDIDVSLSMEAVSLIVEALLLLSEDRFYTFELRDLVSIDCLLSMIPAPELDAFGIRIAREERSVGLVYLDINVAQMTLNISCAGVCSPGMAELAALMSTPEAISSSTEVTNEVLSYVTDLLGGSYLQVAMDRIVNQAHRNCSSSPLYAGGDGLMFDTIELSQQESSVHFLTMLLISAACIISVLLIVMLAVKTFVNWRHRVWLRSLTQRELECVLHNQITRTTKEADMNNSSKSMFLSPEIPILVRFFMPLIILVNVLFFISGHISLGGTVNIFASLGGSALHIDNFFEFSIMESTVQIWNAGGTELAILIIIFSVIWPYTKQLITLVLWFLPPGSVSISRRGSLLLWLDTLAKWSMVDIMTLIVTVAAFRVSIQSPDVAFLPKGFYSVDLVVIPLWGLYSNMIAQLISQISSHFIIFYHRKIEAAASKQHDDRFRMSESSIALPIEDNESGDCFVATTNGEVDENLFDDRVRISESSIALPNEYDETGVCSANMLIIYRRTIEAVARKQHDDSFRTLESSTALPTDDDENGNSLANTTKEQVDETLFDDRVRVPDSSIVLSTEYDEIGVCTTNTTKGLVDENDDCLFVHAFRRPHRTDTDRLRARHSMGPMVLIGWCAVSVFVLVGCILSSFSVEILGFIGVVVESGQGFAAAQKDHSIFTIISLLREQAEFTGRVADRIGLGCLSALLVFSVLVVPIVQSATLVYLWLAKMGTRRRKFIVVAVETMQAWQYADVYLVSVVVAAWQLEPVSDFMINSYCKNLDDTFAQLVYYGVLKEEDAQCFRVQAEVNDGAYVLAAGAVALALLNTFVIKAAIQYFRDLDHKKGDEYSIVQPVEEEESIEESCRENSEKMARQIYPVPVLFSDTFRWCLVREDTVVVKAISDASCSKSGGIGSEKLFTDKLKQKAYAKASMFYTAVHEIQALVFHRTKRAYFDHTISELQNGAAPQLETKPDIGDIEEIARSCESVSESNFLMGRGEHC